MTVKLKPLNEQTIVVTGATSGIGLATAEAAVAAGANVVLAARNVDALAEVRSKLEQAGGKVETVAVDIADKDGAARISAAAITAFGGFDTWVNNAAAATFGRLVDTSVEDHERVFDVGYFGVVRGSLAAVEHLRSRGGALINVGSILSERSVILQGPYGAMKHAVRGFTDSLRTEVEADGWPISVTLIKPSAMNTPFPEHARNLLPKPARLPPILYDPRLSAKAILFAAAHPRRELSIGGAGVAATKAALLMPRLTDRILEVAGRAMQQTDQQPPAGRVDNLYEPRDEAAVESEQDQYVRRTSLWLELQLRPWLPVAVLGGLGAAMAMARPRRR